MFAKSVHQQPFILTHRASDRLLLPFITKLNPAVAYVLDSGLSPIITSSTRLGLLVYR